MTEIMKRKGFTHIPFKPEHHGSIVSMVLYRDQLFVATSEGLYKKTYEDILVPVELIVQEEKL